MFAKERQNEITEMINQKGAVKTSDLVEHFCVSIETIRRDLLEMEQKGQLVRVHGGAVAIEDTKPFRNRAVRDQEFALQKLALCRKAMEFIREGDIIGIDAGSTAAFFARELKEHFSKLTIVTCSLDIFESLHRHKDFKVILCGGYFLEEEKTFYGSFALEMLSRMYMQKVFIFPSAVSLKYGICDYLEEVYLLQKQMMKSAGEIYILADSSKFEKRAMRKLDDMKPGYFYVTDQNLPEELAGLYEENQIQLYKGR